MDHNYVGQGNLEFSYHLMPYCAVNALLSWFNGFDLSSTTTTVHWSTRLRCIQPSLSPETSKAGQTNNLWSLILRLYKCSHLQQHCTLHDAAIKQTWNTNNVLPSILNSFHFKGLFSIATKQNTQKLTCKNRQ